VIIKEESVAHRRITGRLLRVLRHGYSLQFFFWVRVVSSSNMTPRLTMCPRHEGEKLQGDDPRLSCLVLLSDHTFHCLILSLGWAEPDFATLNICAACPTRCPFVPFGPTAFLNRLSVQEHS
jgi:hypothetical protein